MPMPNRSLLSVACFLLLCGAHLSAAVDQAPESCEESTSSADASGLQPPQRSGSLLLQVFGDRRSLWTPKAAPTPVPPEGLVDVKGMGGTVSVATLECLFMTIGGIIAALLLGWLWHYIACLLQPNAAMLSSCSDLGVAASQQAESGERADDRLGLLDNAKVFAQILIVYNHLVYYILADTPNVDARTWLAGSDALLERLLVGFRCLAMPAICFISGVCSQGQATPRRQRRFMERLVIPTLLWLFFCKPVILDSMMSTTPTQTFGQKFSDLLAFKAFHEEWYLQALVLWRVLAYLVLFWLQPCLALLSMVVLSCVAGYLPLETGNTSFLMLGQTLGFLPYFAMGYVFPFRAACIGVPRPRNSIAALVAAMVVVWCFVIVPAVFEGSLALPDGHGSYACCGAGSLFKQAQSWDHHLYWVRRVAKMGVEIMPVLAMMFLVLPRDQTWLSWIGPHTLYPFLFHLLAHTWRGRFLALLPLPHLTSTFSHVIVLLLHVPYTVLVVAMFASTGWRRLFGWCLSPTWLDIVFATGDHDDDEAEAATNGRKAKLAGLTNDGLVSKVRHLFT